MSGSHPRNVEVLHASSTKSGAANAFFAEDEGLLRPEECAEENRPHGSLGEHNPPPIDRMELFPGEEGSSHSGDETPPNFNELENLLATQAGSSPREEDALLQIMTSDPGGFSMDVCRRGSTTIYALSWLKKGHQSYRTCPPTQVFDGMEGTRAPFEGRQHDRQHRAKIARRGGNEVENYTQKGSKHGQILGATKPSLPRPS